VDDKRFNPDAHKQIFAKLDFAYKIYMKEPLPTPENPHIHVEFADVVDQIYGDGAAKWYFSTLIIEEKKRQRIRAFEKAKEVDEAIRAKFGAL